jgi:hypothetical protein
MIPRRSYSGSPVSRLTRFSLPFLTGTLTFTFAGQAQEALRTAVEGDRSYQTRRQQAVESPMPMHWGPVGFSIGAGLRATYDDNVLLEDANPQEDFIIAPGVDLGVYYPITDRTRLNFAVGVEYEIYTEGSREDRFALAPTSQLAFDMEIGRSLITIYDSFSFSQDLLEQPEARSSENYGGFDNTLGFRVFWVPEPLFVETGYSWYMFLSSDEEFSELDRHSHQAFFRLGQVLAERSRWGGEVTASHTLYDTQERNDFTTFSAGPFLEWQATEAIFVNARAGWTWTMFEQSGALPAPDDVSVPYLAFQARHQLTAYFSHELTVVREVRVGINTEFVDSLSFRYGFGWQISDLIRLNAGASYETGEEPGQLATEEFDRLGFDVGLPFQITDQLSLGLRYQFTTRDSNLPTRDYDNNRASLDLTYQFR